MPNMRYVIKYSQHLPNYTDFIQMFNCTQPYNLYVNIRVYAISVNHCTTPQSWGSTSVPSYVNKKLIFTFHLFKTKLLSQLSFSVTPSFGLVLDLCESPGKTSFASMRLTSWSVWEDTEIIFVLNFRATQNSNVPLERKLSAHNQSFPWIFTAEYKHQQEEDLQRDKRVRTPLKALMCLIHDLD